MNNITRSVTAVIATLGDECLDVVINSLNFGILPPVEILICIPHGRKIDIKDYSNVRIIECSALGQVAQRLEGFKEAKGQWVLQLDDDIFLDKNCLSSLVEYSISSDYNISVGPSYYDAHTSKYYSHMNPYGERNFYSELCLYIANGFNNVEPGIITSSGTCIGLPKNKNWDNVQWLPGGCVLHKKENLIVDNYYFYSGKAYAEDLYHSVILRENGVVLGRCSSAICHVDFEKGKSTIFQKSIDYFKSYRAVYRFAKYNHKNVALLTIFYTMNLVNVILKKSR
jgi:glycosyltransferase involved in cell wall biosynthesis